MPLRSYDMWLSSILKEMGQQPTARNYIGKTPQKELTNNSQQAQKPNNSIRINPCSNPYPRN